MEKREKRGTEAKNTRENVWEFAREKKIAREEKALVRKEERDLEVLYENLELEKIHKLESASIIESIQKFIYDAEKDLKRVEGQLVKVQKNPDREKILEIYEELRLKNDSFKVVLKRLEKIEHSDEEFERHLNSFVKRISEDFEVAAKLLKKNKIIKLN